MPSPNQPSEFRESENDLPPEPLKEKYDCALAMIRHCAWLNVPMATVQEITRIYNLSVLRCADYWRQRYQTPPTKNLPSLDETIESQEWEVYGDWMPHTFTKAYVMVRAKEKPHQSPWKNEEPRKGLRARLSAKFRGVFSGLLGKDLVQLQAASAALSSPDMEAIESLLQIGAQYGRAGESFAKMLVEKCSMQDFRTLSGSTDIRTISACDGTWVVSIRGERLNFIPQSDGSGTTDF